jgi:hypothetical protein
MFAIEAPLLRLAPTKAAVAAGMGVFAMRADFPTETGSEGVAVT